MQEREELNRQEQVRLVCFVVHEVGVRVLDVFIEARDPCVSQRLLTDEGAK